ncbi:MAG TPA: hypothetical protein DHW71_07615 [Gammaproteobacteria bacterium]|nr:hypothetical protein [Gammaproteobacteria bacterium]HBF10098.1 hypothetical protein [Gammaproteobacteria bacterium]HCK92837.1 hypothetical protein [Gammaproteobacteria bacterium]
MFKTMFGKPERNMEGQSRIEAAIDGFMTSFEQRKTDQQFLQEFLYIQNWQTQRLMIQYEHLFDNPDSAAAAKFMLHEVYSGDQLAEISEEIKKTARKAWKLAPADLMDAAANAMEANLLTVRIDEMIACVTLERGGMNRANGSELYISALKHAHIISARRQQLAQFSAIAGDIEGYLKKQSLYLGLKMTSGLARKAGVSNLHRFLMRACTVLRGTKHFERIVNEIYQTELTLLDELERGINPYQFMDTHYLERAQI